MSGIIYKYTKLFNRLNNRLFIQLVIYVIMAIPGSITIWKFMIIVVLNEKKI